MSSLYSARKKQDALRKGSRYTLISSESVYNHYRKLRVDKMTFFHTEFPWLAVNFPVCDVCTNNYTLESTEFKRVIVTHR